MNSTEKEGHTVDSNQIGACHRLLITQLAHAVLRRRDRDGDGVAQEWPQAGVVLVTVSSAVRRSAGGRLVGRRMSGRRHARRHVGRPLPAAQKVAKGLSEVG